MVVHFTLIGRVLEQTGSSRQKTLQFEYFDGSRTCLETLELQYYETDAVQMRSDGTYFVQGTVSLQDGVKPKLLAISVTELHFNSNDLPCLTLEMNAIIVVKSAARLLLKDGTLYHFEGEMSGYNSDKKREETYLLTFTFDGALPLFKKIMSYLLQSNAVGKVLDVHFEYQPESDHDRAYGHLKRINFTQLTRIMSTKSRTSHVGSNIMQADRPTLLGKRSASMMSMASPPVPSASSPTSSSSSLSKQTSTFQASSSKSATRQQPHAYGPDMSPSKSSNSTRLSISASPHSASIISMDDNLETELSDPLFGMTVDIDQHDEIIPSTSLSISEKDNSLPAFHDSPSIPFALPSSSSTDTLLPTKRRRIARKLD